MQGSIFTVFADMILETQGMVAWDELLTEANPASGGCYTSGKQYDDQELLDMVAILSRKTGLPANELVVGFGKFLFKRLYDSSPADISHITDLKTFLLAIDSVIHAEVKRLHPNAYLPAFEYADDDNGDLIMYYHSKRMLCAAAEGLILGAAEQFNETITFRHPQCMHKGAERCQFIISFEGAP